MKKVVSMVLVLGFLVVDFLFFHDLFKAGEVTSFAQKLTGILSILVFVVCVQSVLESETAK